MRILALKCEMDELGVWAARYKVDERERHAIDAGIKARAQGWLTPDEFLTIAMWKSARPVAQYRKNNEESVRSVTAEAFAAAGDVERALILTELHGVKVRTATAMLHLCHRDTYPVLDVWAMTSLGYPRNETETWDELTWLRMWPGYVAYCRELAGEAGLDMRTLDRALWSFGEDAGSRRRNKK